MINNPNKSRILLAIIAVLVVANMALLAFFLQKPAHIKQAGRADMKTIISNFLKTEIGFSDQQLLSYDSLSNLHRERMSTLFDTVRNNKTLHFKQLVQAGFSDSAINTIADASAATQKVMAARTFNHIKKIRQLCTPEQLPRYDSLFHKVLNRRGEGRKKSGK